MELIPAEYYTIIYYQVLLLMVLVLYAQGTRLDISDAKNLQGKQGMANALFIFLILYMGLRPISARWFGDMRTYANFYADYAGGAAVTPGKDIYFEYFMKWLSGFMPVEGFFFICALLYIIPLFVATRKLFGKYAPYGFIMIVLSMSFWSYGVNGIRNGIATSIFILAISRTRLAWQILLLVLSTMFHQSMWIPVIAWVIAWRYTHTKVWLWFWGLAIPLSLAFGGSWENLVLQLGLGTDERLQVYLSDEENEFQEQFASIGFRWDFLLYSATGVFAGWYYLIKKKFEDPVYSHIFNTYLIANGFWILIIRATFSNRFAYLSWFLLALVILYPLLVTKFFHKQNLVVSRIMLVYFIFTYLINFVLL